MAGFRIEGDVSGNVMEVDADGNGLVTLPDVGATAGYVRVADKFGNGMQFSDHGRVKVGMEGILFHDPIDGAVLNTNLWTIAAVTMASAINTQFILLNSAAITTINTSYRITSSLFMPFIAHYPLQFHCKAKTPNIPQSNANMELGLANATGVTPPTDGVFFRWAADGVFRCVLANASVETTVPVTAPTVNVGHHFIIYYTHGEARYEIDGVLVATIPFPAAAGSLTAVSRLPILARVSTGGSVPALAPQLYVTEPNVAQMDLNWGKRWTQQLARLGRGGFQSPVTTFLQTANHTNSTSPASATLSNTAAGYPTLGGRYQFAAPVGAATDFCLFGFQIPTGYQFILERAIISAMNTGAAVATTATVLDWSVAVGSSAVSLATAEAAGTAWAPRRVPVGMQGFIVGAGIGAAAPGIDIQFESPLACDGGRFVQIIVQVPIGTATASQIIRGDVMLNGYFE